MILIHFLLISAVSVLIGDAADVNDVLHAINNYFLSGGDDLGMIRNTNLRLVPGMKLGRTAHSVVWQGIYKDHINVAVKIYWKENLMKKELDVYRALNATKNPDIGQIGIQKVYYKGPILREYDAIAMTLCQQTLENYYQLNEKSGKLPDLLMLAIFRQLITTLEYIHRMDVLHNDIKPENIFLIGQKIFIGGFDLATTNGRKNEGHTLKYASATFFSLNPFRKRNQMDDLQSSVYSMLHISGVRLGWTWLFGIGIPEGFLLSTCNKEEAIARMMEKLAHFRHPTIHNAMKNICVDEMLSGQSVPNYGRIVAEIDRAIADYK